MTKPIDEKDFTTRTYNALKRNGITMYEEIENLTDEQLLKKRAIGIKVLNELRQGAQDRK